MMIDKLGLRILAGVAILVPLTAMPPANAHRLNAAQHLRQTGTHWCTWSAAKVCAAWRARGGKYICPPAEGTDRRAARHHGAARARNWLKTFRHFFRWCESQARAQRSDLGHPTQGPEVGRAPHLERGRDRRVRGAHPIGSKARLALALGLYTAQRRGDVVRMGRQHIRNGELAVRQKKTGTPLTIPVLPELQAIIDATPIGHLTLLTTKTGKSYGANDFSDQFRNGATPPACRPSARSTACARRR